MKRKIEMPEVSKCAVGTCVYNHDGGCHARAITVGGGADHKCDTMMPAQGHAHRMDPAGVGACRATTCIHNEDFECQADGIAVLMRGGQADCATFAER
ncbi:MAG: DUF1540 domain-containing protein [Kiritimatiellia bacterium]